LIYDFCALLLLAGAYLVSKIWDYSFLHTIVAISVAGFISYAIYAFVLIAVVERHLSNIYLHRHP
jgi:hypothetical protein